MKKILYTTALLLIILVSVYSISKGQEITVSPNVYMFDDTFIGETTSADFNFENIGTEVLNISDITFTNDAFSIDYTAFAIQPGLSGDLPVHFTPPASGLYEGIMQVWSDDPINNPYEVDLSGNGIVELIDGWEWIETGFNFILMDIEFPEGQNQIGYSIGQSLTYNGDGIVIKTTDGGTTWEQLTPDGIPGLQGCSFLDVNTGFAAGWDGYLIKTTDGGVTWDTIVIQSGIWQIKDVEFWDINHGVVTAWTDGTFVTEDGGLTWTEATGITTAPQMIEYADENTVFVVGGEDRINRSTDGGYTWTEVYGDGNNEFVLLGVDFLDSNYGMAAGDYGHIYTTIDGGDSWTFSEAVGDQLLHTPFIWDEDTSWVCGTPEMVFKTTDGGNNWNSAYNGNYQKAFYRILFTDNYTGFICGGSGGIVLRKEGLPSAPALSVTPTTYVFDDTFVGESTSADFTFANTGTEVLNVTDVTFTNPAFSIEYTAFPIQPGLSGDVAVHFEPPASGFYEGTMQIWSDDPINNPYEVELSGNGVVELIDGWEWIETGFNFILMDIEFPAGQNQVGYAVGQSYTYNGDGIVLKTEDSGYTWTQLTPDGIPGLEEMSFLDTQTGYAAGWDGYVIKTTDGGATWDTLNVAIGMWEITDIEFYDADNGILLEGANVYLTEDGGETWLPGGTLANSGYMVDYLDANTMVVVGNENYIYKSTDGGYNWSVKNTGIIGELLLGVHFLDDHYGLAAGDYGYIFKTEDGGNTWTSSQQVGDELLHAPFIWDEDTAWVCGTPERVFKTTDGGVNWNNAYNGNYQKAFYRILFTDNYTGFICGGSGGIVLRKEGLPSAPALSVTPTTYVFDDTFVGESTSANFNFANTGTEVLNVTDVTFTNPAFSIDYTAFPIQPGQSGDVAVHFEPLASGLYEGIMQIWSDDPINNPYEVELSGNGVVELIDGWEWIETGFNFILMDVEFPEGQNQVGYTVGENLTYNGDGIVLKTIDGGSTWSQMTPEGIPGLTGMSFIDMNTGYAVGWDDYLIKTTDGGLTWDTLNYASGTFSFYYDVEFWDENNGVVLAGVDVYITDDGGDTWTMSNGVAYSCTMIEYLNENTLIAVGNENHIYKSIDGGLNWSLKNSGGNGTVLLGVDFLDDHYGMAAGDYGYIFTTYDGGETWTEDTQVGDQLLHTPYIWDEDSAWVCGTPEMVYKTTNGGTNWNSAYNGNYQRAFYRIMFTDNYTGFISSSGGVILRREGLPEIPAINVTPEEIEFEDTYVGENTSEILFISNPGFADLEVTDITSTNSVFSVDMTTFIVEPGDVQEITVTFTPDDEGLFEGLLQIENTDPENSMVEVTISGNGMIAYPAIEINPGEIIFDTTLIDETTMEIITISNTGIATLNVSDISSTNTVFSVNMTSFDLEPDGSQEIEVSFTPNEQMLFEGILQIESNDPNGTIEIDLSGYGDIDTYIGDYNSNSSVRIYPNPAKDKIYLENVKGKEILIYDLLGNLKLSHSAESNTEVINVSDYVHGLYLVKIVGTEGIITKKLEVIR